jgi:hypothetical protein
MAHHVPLDIQQIVHTLQIHHMQVTGPMSSGENILYHVNGHALTAGELRELATKNLLTSWGIFTFATDRAAKRVG